MIRPATLALLLASAAPALAQAPEKLSTHADWEVAFLTEQGRRTCYAFTRAITSEGAAAGRTAPVVTVTHRQGSRDQVALLAGVPFATATEVPVEVAPASFQFYSGGSSAFARDGAAVVAAFRRGRQAVFRIPAAQGRAAITDRASLRGFAAAHDALNRCAGGSAPTPPPRR